MGQEASTCCAERDENSIIETGMGSSRRLDTPRAHSSVYFVDRQLDAPLTMKHAKECDSPRTHATNFEPQTTIFEADNNTDLDGGNNRRKDGSWRYSRGMDHVGVGAYFEGGAIRVRALAKGGPSANSGMINVGDELVRVEDQDVHGRPLSELGQFILGVPGTSVLLTFISRSDKTKYEILLVRSKVVSIPPEPFLPLGRIIRESASASSPTAERTPTSVLPTLDNVLRV